MRSPSFLDLRRKSLLRGSALVIGSLALAFFWAGFPQIRADPRLILPMLLALVGTGDTLRCIRAKWSFYHGGVILLLYMDIMAVAMILFLLLYPYDGWLL